MVSEEISEQQMRLINICIENACDDPVKLFRLMYRSDDVPINGPIHHTIVPLALITAYWYVVGDFNLKSYLEEASKRACEVPEATCGYWGCCGSSIGTGIFYSIITKTGPLSRGKRWGNGNRFTSDALLEVAKVGGPRCCKRNSVLSIQSACETLKKYDNVELKPSEFSCTFMSDNKECIGIKCPFYNKCAR